MIKCNILKYNNNQGAQILFIDQQKTLRKDMKYLIIGPLLRRRKIKIF
jgi:hypothetical protein